MTHCKFLLFRSNKALCFLVALSAGLAASILNAQGLKPTPVEDYRTLPIYSPTVSTETVTRTVDGQIVAEVRVVEGPLPDLPSSIDLSEFAPQPGRQRFNDCTAWAVAYCSYSTQMALARKKKSPVQAIDLFSPRYIYSQINNGTDSGSHIFLANSSQPSAVRLLERNGCASEATTPYNSSTNGWNIGPNTRGVTEAKNYRAVYHTRCESIDDIRYSLVFGIPVVIAAWVPTDFQNADGFSTYRWSGVRNGRHAMCIIGYDNQRQAFLVQNSWGSNWGDNGRIWVAFDNFEELDAADPSLGWCFEAHVIIADASRQTQLRRTVNPNRSFFFLPNGSIQEQFGNGTTQQLLAPNSLHAAESSSRYLYGLKADGTIIGLDGPSWYNVIDGPFPTGLSGGRGTMIASSFDFLYAITEAGSVIGRVPANTSTGSGPYWELINLPDGEKPIDIRFRDSSIYVASDDGDIFKRIAGQGWQRQ